MQAGPIPSRTELERLPRGVTYRKINDLNCCGVNGVVVGILIVHRTAVIVRLDGMVGAIVEDVRGIQK